jgi:hypothetical protein
MEITFILVKILYVKNGVGEEASRALIHKREFLPAIPTLNANFSAIYFVSMINIFVIFIYCISLQQII